MPSSQDSACKETSSFTPIRRASEQRHKDPQGLSPAPADDTLHALSLLQQCLDPANFYTSAAQRLSPSWRAYAASTRLFHWVHWAISDADYVHVPERCTFTSKHAHLYMHSPVVFRILQLLSYREGWSKAEEKWCWPSPTIISYTSHPWLRCPFQQGIPFSRPNCSTHFYYLLLDFFFIWLWEATTKVEYIGHMGRVLNVF